MVIINFGIFLLFIGCEKSDIDNDINKAFSFIGVWKINSVEKLDYKSEYGKNDIDSFVGQEIKLDNDRISILDNNKTNVSYKLKVVGSDYM